MAEYLSPGVFNEEVPSTVQVIQGVSTSNMGIVGFTPKGPTDVATLITSAPQYARKFGDLTANSFTGHSVLAFYANGGRRCFVVRVVPGDAEASDMDIQSKVYDHQLDVGDGATTAFSETALTTTLQLPVIGKNANNPSTFAIRWREAGTPVAGERVKDRGATTDILLADGLRDIEFRLNFFSFLATLSEGDLKQYVVDPTAVTIYFDPQGAGVRSLTLDPPTSGTTSITNGDGVTTDSATTIFFDFATGVGSIHFGNADINDVPDSAVVDDSLVADYTPTTTSRMVVDNGLGALVDGTPLALTGPGTIDYNDGSWSFTASNPPHNGAPILVTYYWEAWNLDPVSKGVWADGVKVNISGNVDFFDTATQSYSRHNMTVLEFSSSSGSYEVQESYDALDFVDSTSAQYFPDVINELSDLVSVEAPGGDAYPGTLDGQQVSVVLGGGNGLAGNDTFAPAVVLAPYLLNQGLEIGPRSVSITATSDGTEATGSITVDAQANFSDGEHFILDDGVNPPVRFEFDQTGAYVPSVGAVEVDISADVTANDVRDCVIDQINGVVALNMHASIGGAGIVALQNVNQGAYNTPIAYSSVGILSVTGMSGGIAQTALSVVDDGTGLLTGDVDPAYATVVSAGGVDLQPNTINYATGYANFKLSDVVAGGTAVVTTFYTTPEETVRDELFGDVNKRYTDSLATVHYQGGSDGTFDSTNYSRSQFTSPTLQATKRGVYALNEIDELMQVVIPDFAGDTVVTGDLLDYAASRAALPAGGDRFIILTVPKGSDPQEAVDWFRFDLGRFSKWAALYWPWVKISDPLTNRTLVMPPLGHIAGVYARTDSNRNVGKAPAGTVDGALNFLTGLEYIPTQGERDYVYPYKINPLISSPQTGLAVWGARTIATESEWRYINARRLFMFLEKSVYNATGWIVFESNGPALWTRIKGQLESFMTQQFNAGLFFGNTPAQAFFVIVDDSNNDAASIEAGQVIIDVGAAPNRPAEIVRFRWSQMTLG